VPLVRQSTDDETYRIQRICDARRAEQVQRVLSPEQLEAKLRARDEVYSILTAQMPAVSAIPRTELAVEVIAPAPADLPEPGGDRVLRYERRARLLLERGEIARMITYAGHYVPLATALLAHASH
jgi:hypothetical protein